MSISGMKKQFRKASQRLNERLTGAEGTRMDDDFQKLQKSVSVIDALVAELLSRTTELLQPNPAYRAKVGMLSTVSRIRGQARATGYPQTERILGNCMVSYGQQLGAASEFGGALTDVGGALQQIGQARDALNITVKQTFIDPLQKLHHSELKQIKFQLKKLNSQRLDLDYKKRQQGKVAAGELQRAWDKFSWSTEMAERSMFVLLQNEADLVSHLAALISGLLDFHRNTQHILLGLHGNLQARLTAASNKPERRFRSRKVQVQGDHNSIVGLDHQPSDPAFTSSGERHPVVPSGPSRPISNITDNNLVLDQPCCRAMYSFLPSHDGELEFSEGDIILLVRQVDANWYEGSLGARSGLLPACYVDVLVPLPLP
uniref:SH3-domain GRB2-like 3b n=1 Tax=Nothobranchius kuhntae TaxID=321403 RepID=A0A1A8J0Z2_NOTKU